MKIGTAWIKVTVALCALLGPFQTWADNSQTIKLGWSGPLTGNSAVLGIDSLKAVQIAVEQANSVGGINGKKLELIAEDDQYDTAKAVSAYSSLVSKGVVAIIASTYGGIFATAQKAQKDNILLIDPLDCNNDIAKLSENTFCIATESESIGRIIVDDISQKKLQPIAVLYDEKNPFMTLVQVVIGAKLGADPNAYFAGLDQSNADFKSVLLRAKSKGAKSVVFLGHDPMGQAMREARNLGIAAQFYTVGTITSPGYQKLAGDFANGTLVAYWEAPRGAELANFLKDFQAKVGRPPILELATIPSYDAAKILVGALQHASAKNGNLDISEVKKYIYALKDYRGLSGAITMDADGAVRSIRETIYLFERGNLKSIAH